ncbi:MAG: hypothetical protein GC179_29365 [Anaerolineaceae bacterium]|nr:hypothetical protein [Anaerolineaceae bacterium]
MNVFLPDKSSIIAASKYELTSSLMNKILYSMCEENPYHKDEEIIKSKLMLIGRSYSAALERRRNKKGEPEDIYALVAHSLKESGIDKQIETLKEKKLDCVREDDFKTINQILQLHKSFVYIVYSHVEMHKRSLASKYLHFHLPNLVFCTIVLPSSGWGRYCHIIRLWTLIKIMIQTTRNFL